MLARQGEPQALATRRRAKPALMRTAYVEMVKN
jgi:hypothetical protein